MDTAFIFSFGIPLCEKKNNISSLALEVSSGRSPLLAKLTADTCHLTQLSLQFHRVKACALSPGKAKSTVHESLCLSAPWIRCGGNETSSSPWNPPWSAARSCLSHCKPMDCSPPGSSVYGISTTRTLVWVAVFSSRVEAADKACNPTPVPFVVVVSFRIIECGFFLCILFYTGAQLINNVVLVSGLQQSGSFMHIHVSNIFKLFSQLGCRILTRTPSNQKEWRWLEYNSFSVADERKNPKVWEHDLVRLTLNKPQDECWWACLGCQDWGNFWSTVQTSTNSWRRKTRGKISWVNRVLLPECATDVPHIFSHNSPCSHSGNVHNLFSDGSSLFYGTTFPPEWI